MVAVFLNTIRLYFLGLQDNSCILLYLSLRRQRNLLLYNTVVVDFWYEIFQAFIKSQIFHVTCHLVFQFVPLWYIHRPRGGLNRWRTKFGIQNVSVWRAETVYFLIFGRVENIRIRYCTCNLVISGIKALESESIRNSNVECNRIGLHEATETSRLVCFILHDLTNLRLSRICNINLTVILRYANSQTHCRNCLFYGKTCMHSGVEYFF